MTFSKPLIFSVFSLGFLLVLGGIFLITDESGSQPAMTILHVDDSCKTELRTCTATQTVLTNGHMASSGEPYTLDKHVFSEEEIAKLESLVFSSNLSKNESPVCAPDYAGPDVAFMYPNKYGSQKFFLCAMGNWEDVPVLKHSMKMVSDSDLNR